jgi:heme oxygenase
LLEQIHLDTASHHAAADDDRLSILTREPTPASYVAYLARIHGFEAAIHDALVGRRAGALDVRERLGVVMLRADLVALGIEPAVLPRCTGPSALRSPESLGWLYVVERARRLNGIVERHLRPRLPEELALAGRYLTCARTTGTRWRELGDAMHGAAPSIGDARRIVDAARLAFRCQRGWLSPRLESPRLVA